MGFKRLYGHLEKSSPKAFSVVEATANNIISSSGENSLECEFLHVDCNNLIHSLGSHCMKAVGDKSHEEYANVFRFLDRLIETTKPRRQVFIAIGNS